MTGRSAGDHIRQFREHALWAPTRLARIPAWVAIELLIMSLPFPRLSSQRLCGLAMYEAHGRWARPAPPATPQQDDFLSSPVSVARFAGENKPARCLEARRSRTNVPMGAYLRDFHHLVADASRLKSIARSVRLNLAALHQAAETAGASIGRRAATGGSCCPRSSRGRRREESAAGRRALGNRLCGRSRR